MADAATSPEAAFHQACRHAASPSLPKSRIETPLSLEEFFEVSWRRDSRARATSAIAEVRLFSRALTARAGEGGLSSAARSPSSFEAEVASGPFLGNRRHAGSGGCRLADRLSFQSQDGDVLRDLQPKGGHASRRHGAVIERRQDGDWLGAASHASRRSRSCPSPA